MSREKPCFVQFIHPGGEHGMDEDGLKRWNTGAHRRKFILRPGSGTTSDGVAGAGDLIFWGEWEAESCVEPIESPVEEGPRFVHRLFYSDPPPAGWRQNTDPFVFGEQFHYTGCLQHTRQGPTQLRFLSRGSVLLFGSSINRSKFVLDTAFVVDGYVDHEESDHRDSLGGQISDVYRAVTIDPWYSGSGVDPRSYRLYYGATPETAVEGMFSFFPASTPQRHPQGFARPEISLNVITPNLTQGKRLNPQRTLADVRALWERVVEQVERAGLLLGVHAEFPPARAL